MAVINGRTSSNSWTFRLDVYNINNYNVNDNTSTMRVDVWIGRASTASNSYIGGTWSGHISIDWQTPNQYSIPISGTIPYPTTMNSGSWYHLATRDFTITHDNDGKKVQRVVSEINQTEFTPSYCVADGYVTLVTIPRATDLPTPGLAYIEDTLSLQLSPKISNAKHSLKMSFGNLTQWLQSDGTLGSSEVKLSNDTLSIFIPKEYYLQFNSAVGEGTMYLYTYNGDNKIGESSKAFKATCVPSLCTPQVDAMVVDINPITTALTGDVNTVIANASHLLVTPTIQISDIDDTGAFVTSKSIDNTVFTTDTVTMFEPTKKDFLLNVTNNRTLTGKKTVSATGNLIPYIKLTFNIDKLYRPESTGSEIVLKYNGKYFAGEFTSESTTSHNLFIGDDLAYNNIVCAFPDNLWEQMGTDDKSVDIITTDQYKVFYYVINDSDTNQVMYGVALESLTEPDNNHLELYHASGEMGGTPTVHTNSSDLIINMSFGIIDYVNSSDNIVYPFITKTTVQDSVKNELSLWWKYKSKNDEEYIEGGILTPTIDNEKNTYSGEVTLGDMFDYKQQYEFQFFYKDKVIGIEDNVYLPAVVTRGIPVYWWTADSFHIQGDLYVEGQINPTS